jgi:hypothetical protein
MNTTDFATYKGCIIMSLFSLTRTAEMFKLNEDFQPQLLLHTTGSQNKLLLILYGEDRGGKRQRDSYIGDISSKNCEWMFQGQLLDS